MRRPLFLILFFSFIIAGCFGARNPGLPADKPGLVEEKETGDPFLWDFGQAKEGEILRHEFTLRNDSQKALRINDIQTSCGCTASRSKKKDLLPGERTAIEVKFNSKGYSGAVQQYIYVHTDSLGTSAALGINGGIDQGIDNPVFRFIIKVNVIKR